MPRMTRTIALFFLLLISGSPLLSSELQPDTVRAWNRYIEWANAKVQREISDPSRFSLQSGLPAAEKQEAARELNNGGVFVHTMTGVIPQGTEFSVPGGEIHHWWGAILVRNAQLPRLLKSLQDYDHHAGKFADVERSRLISVDGDHYRAFLRLRRSKSFVTAVYNTEQDCRYTVLGPTRAFSQSVAVKIAEVDAPGTPSEREKAPGDDRGFLWRLVSWWRFEQRGDDVLVELESASLSRDIPSFVKFIPGVTAYIQSTPRESLESVLTSVRNLK